MAGGAIPAQKNDRVRVNASDNSADFLENKLESSDGSIDINVSSCGCTLDLTTASSSSVTEEWIIFSVDYTLFNTPATIVVATPPELANIPAGSIILNYKLKQSVGFTGGSVTESDVSLFTNGSVFADAKVFNPPTVFGGEYGAIPQGAKILNHSASDIIQLRLICVGDTCDNLTAGELDVWVKIAILP